MKPLYQLTGEMAVAMTRFEAAETEEDIEKFRRELTDLQVPFADKCSATAKYILSVEADQTALETEIERLQARLKSVKGQASWLKNYLFSAMQATDTPEIKTPTIILKIVSNPPSVEVTDAALIPEAYMRTIPERKEPDLVKIKDAWKDGVGVTGTKVNSTKRLKIK